MRVVDDTGLGPRVEPRDLLHRLSALESCIYEMPFVWWKRNHKQVPFSCITRAFSRYDALNTHQHSWIEVKR